jgi:membrane associated rhomboid family serine protease
MIPLRDNIQSRHYPVVTMGFIGINVVVYFLQMAQGPEFQQFVYTYGLVPARYTMEEVSRHFTTGEQFVALFSFMFLHGGFLHILGNMWILYLFGDNVEDYLGSFYFAIFYIAGGFFSGMAHLLLYMDSTTPVIGASGAVAAVMGAYFILYPTSRILTLIPIVFIPFFVEIPAFIFLGIWFMLQVFNAAGAAGGGPGIAWWAHIGGFVFGVAVIKISRDFFLGMPENTRKKRWDGIARRTSEHLQVIDPDLKREGLDLEGTVKITPFEASTGATKTLNIPSGFQKRLYRIKIPQGVKDGSRLRLRGLGRKSPGGETGDLYLDIQVKEP